MRRSKQIEENQISMLTLDDDAIFPSTIQAYFQRSGYQVDIENDPNTAIERIRNGNYDILLLDFLMSPICGDQVVKEIRKFNQDIYIILLTGHKSMAPPVKTIRELEIQGYYEKDNRFDHLELLVESCVKSIKQMKTIREYQAQVQEQNEKLIDAYMQTIETLRYVVESRDKETRGHSERVSMMATALAKEMRMNETEVNNIRLAGLFHDIGKIGVPDMILLKNGPLTNEEYAEIKKHPVEGEKILTTYTPFKDILPIVRGHHERYDGYGYPDGLSESEICIGARVVAVADAFDAIVSKRVYRNGLGFDYAIKELIAEKNAQFDSMVVDVMLDYINEYGRQQFEKDYFFGIKTNEKETK